MALAHDKLQQRKHVLDIFLLYEKITVGYSYKLYNQFEDSAILGILS